MIMDLTSIDFINRTLHRLARISSPKLLWVFSMVSQFKSITQSDVSLFLIIILSKATSPLDSDPVYPYFDSIYGCLPSAGD